MGFKEGEGIGKRHSGMVEPIAVNLKQNKSGLGIDEEQRRKKQRKKEAQAHQGQPNLF